MARGKGGSDIAKLMAKANALLEKHGVDTSKIEPTDGPGTNYRSEDAAVVFVNYPPHFRPGKCKNCGKVFAVNKPAVGFCSNECRKEDWRRTMHVPYAAISTHDVWYGDPPMILTPEQLTTLEGIARWFIQNQTILEIEPLPEYNPPAPEPHQVGLSGPLGEIPQTLQEDRNHPIPHPSETFDLFEEEEQTDRTEVYPRTNYHASLYQSTLEQNTEVESAFDFD